MNYHKDPPTRFLRKKLRTADIRGRNDGVFRLMVEKVTRYCFSTALILCSRYCEEHGHSAQMLALSNDHESCATRRGLSHGANHTRVCIFMAVCTSLDFPKMDNDCPTCRREVFRGKGPSWKRRCRATSQGDHEYNSIRTIYRKNINIQIGHAPTTSKHAKPVAKIISDGVQPQRPSSLRREEIGAAELH